ncbi:MAG: glycerol-3-phosphate dehydrogenase [Eubacteriaceae bacterium]|jgi:glycerol-3-phosphate dehydrogenase (NAD(P)+)
MSVLTFIGSGQMASALSFPAFENGNEVRLVGTPLDREVIDGLKKNDYHINLKRTLPHGVKYYQIEDVKEALDGADAVLCGVSSFGVDWFADNILPVLDVKVPLISVTKGMIDQDDGSMITYVDYWKSKLPEDKKDLSINAIGGPCTSYELADHDDSAVAFCGDNIETLRYLKGLFESPYYHINLSTDVTGVECAVALKNAYALAVTLAVGLAEKREGEGAIHYNSQAALFQQSIKEMTELLALAGGGPENLIYGAGDLYVTVFGGRTRRIGTLLGRGLSFDEAMQELAGVTLESIVIATRTASAVKKLAAAGKADTKDFPLLMHIDDIINNGAPVNIPWKAFETETVR